MNRSENFYGDALCCTWQWEFHHSTIRSRVHTLWGGVNNVVVWMRSCGLYTYIYHRVYGRSVFAWRSSHFFKKKIETDLVNFWLSNRHYTVWLTTSNFISSTRRIFTCGRPEKRGDFLQSKKNVSTVKLSFADRVSHVHRYLKIRTDWSVI
jgi:hypothetical protein